MREKNHKEYYTASDVARLCATSHMTVHLWVRAGELPAAFTPGGHVRVHKTRLREFLTAHGFEIPEELREREQAGAQA